MTVNNAYQYSSYAQGRYRTWRDSSLRCFTNSFIVHKVKILYVRKFLLTIRHFWNFSQVCEMRLLFLVFFVKWRLWTFVFVKGIFLDFLLLCEGFFGFIFCEVSFRGSIWEFLWSVFYWLFFDVFYR